MGTNILPVHHAHCYLRAFALAGCSAQNTHPRSLSGRYLHLQSWVHILSPWKGLSPILAHDSSSHSFATTFSIFLYKAGHSVKLFHFLVQFCFPNSQYNVNTVTRNLSSLFTNVVLIPRTIPGTINKYSRQRFIKLPGSLKETCFEADYKITCSVRRKK